MSKKLRDVEKAYFTSSESAEYTGFSEVYFRKGRSKSAKKDGVPHPPYLRVGRTIRYRRKDLDAWMGRFRVEPGGQG